MTSRTHPVSIFSVLSGSNVYVKVVGKNIDLICLNNDAALNSIARYCEYKELLNNFNIRVVNLNTKTSWILAKTNKKMDIDFSQSKEILSANCTVFTSFQYLNSEIIRLLNILSEEEKPAAIIHSSGLLKAANKAWVDLCECPGEEVVKRNISEGYMHPSTYMFLEKEHLRKREFEARYSAYWSENNFLQVVSKMTRIEVSLGCWYSLNILQDWKKGDPLLVGFEFKKNEDDP